MAEKRVRFDFEIDFANGGGLQGQDFRLDIEGDDISDEALAAYIVRDLRLLMVGAVRILNKAVFEEPHKRKGGAASARGAVSSRVVDLTGAGTALRAADTALAALADLPGVVARLTGAKAAEIPAVLLAATEVADRAVLIHTGWGGAGDAPRLAKGAAAHLREAGARLVGLDAPIAGAALDILRGAGIPVVERLACLDALPIEGFRVFAVPGVGEDAVRAFACLDPAT